MSKGHTYIRYSPVNLSGTGRMFTDLFDTEFEKEVYRANKFNELCYCYGIDVDVSNALYDDFFGRVYDVSTADLVRFYLAEKSGSSDYPMAVTIEEYNSSLALMSTEKILISSLHETSGENVSISVKAADGKFEYIGIGYDEALENYRKSFSRLRTLGYPIFPTEIDVIMAYLRNRIDASLFPVECEIRFYSGNNLMFVRSMTLDKDSEYDQLELGSSDE